MDGSVPAEKAPHLSAGLYQAEIAETAVAQMPLFRSLPLGLGCCFTRPEKMGKLLETIMGSANRRHALGVLAQILYYYFGYDNLRILLGLDPLPFDLEHDFNGPPEK